LIKFDVIVLKVASKELAIMLTRAQTECRSLLGLVQMQDNHYFYTIYKQKGFNAICGSARLFHYKYTVCTSIA